MRSIGGHSGGGVDAPPLLLTIRRRTMPPTWLAVVATRHASVIVSLADDVAEGDVAAVVRHLLARHRPDVGVRACHDGICDAVWHWRPIAACTEAEAGATA